MSEPSPDVMRAWIRLNTAGQAILAEIENSLKTERLPPLSWYDALYEIEKAGAAGLRPHMLQERLLLPQYTTSRLLDRLAREGLIDRDACPDDGRGQVVAITPEGRALRHRMWPVYSAVLENRLGKRLEPAETSALSALLGRLVG